MDFIKFTRIWMLQEKQFSGGTLGLFCGMSLLSGVEILIGLINCLKKFFLDKCNHGNQTQSH